MTLLELLITITLISVLASVTAVRSARLIDALAVRSAQHEVAALFGYARDVALGTQQATAVHIDAPGGTLTVAQGATVLTTRRLGDRRIHLTTTRDSMAYTATGLGFGAANLRIALSRGGYADTIVVSRLGRVERR